MKTEKYKIIFITVVFILVLVLLYSYKNISVSVENKGMKNVDSSTGSKKENISATLIVGGKKILLTSQINSSLYDVLLEAKKNNQINFTGKVYPLLGFFVDSIDNLKNKDGKYLFYYINGKEASVGVSNYILKDGDVIEWKLK